MSVIMKQLYSHCRQYVSLKKSLSGLLVVLQVFLSSTTYASNAGFDFGLWVEERSQQDTSLVGGLVGTIVSVFKNLLDSDSNEQTSYRPNPTLTFPRSIQNEQQLFNMFPYAEPPSSTRGMIRSHIKVVMLR